MADHTPRTPRRTTYPLTPPPSRHSKTGELGAGRDASTSPSPILATQPKYWVLEGKDANGLSTKPSSYHPATQDDILRCDTAPLSVGPLDAVSHDSAEKRLPEAPGVAHGSQSVYLDELASLIRGPHHFARPSDPAWRPSTSLLSAPGHAWWLVRPKGIVSTTSLRFSTAVTKPREPLFLEVEDDEMTGTPECRRVIGVAEDHGITYLGVRRSQAVVPRSSSSSLSPTSTVLGEPNSSLQLHYDEELDLTTDRPHKRRRQSASSAMRGDIEYTGMLQAPQALRIEEAIVVDDDVGTPLREVEGVCAHCGCDCGVERRGRGSGSNTLSNRVRGNILALVMGGGRTLFEAPLRPSYASWADVAEAVGARREDFDRVRHCARWLQNNLPAMMRQGRI